MQTKLVPAIAAAVIGAGLLVGALPSQAPRRAPAPRKGSEAKLALRVNLSTTDFEFARRSPTTPRAGRCST